jgi:hypothetical protein
MDNTPSTNRMASERSARYLDEVLLQPEQVDDVALTGSDRDPGQTQDDLEHPHGDY